jgi:dTDP-4-amino-4,6-dideoxygalactose transaminase
VLHSGETRDALMVYLKQHGISAVFHFVPLHTSPMGMQLGYREGDLPITEDLSRRLLRIPSFSDITEAQQIRIVNLITAFLHRRQGVGKSTSSFSSRVSAAMGILR